MSIFNKIGANIKKNTNSTNYKKMGYALLGGVIYALVPTAVQGFFKVNMSGWKGWFTGTLSSVFTGFAVDKPEIAFGGFATAGLHIIYVHGNDTVASFLGAPIYAFDKSAQLMDYATSYVPAGMREVILPDGSKVLATQESPSVSDYISALPQPQLQDYIGQLPKGGPSLNDFTNALPIGGLNDFMNDVAMGRFN